MSPPSVLALLLCLLHVAPAAAQALDAALLYGDAPLPRPVPMAAFAPPATHESADAGISGTLQIAASRGGLAVHEDRYGYAEAGGERIRELPAVSVGLLRHGDDLLPLATGIVDSGHPRFEYAFRPGRIWQDGEHARAALPFALVERNANCTHNGVMSWLVDAAGRWSRIAFQVSAETCAYFKFDLWGLATAAFEPSAIDGGTRTALFEENRARRLPVQPVGALKMRYGASPDAFGAVAPMRAGDMSVYGLVVDGVHYRGGCETRHGDYPFCDELVLPSYSTAKSLFAALGLMQLEKRWPGTRERRVAELVPECSRRRWGGVTLEHLLDMSTGLYRDAGYEADEASGPHVAFLYEATHAGRIEAACALFPKRSRPGRVWAYHTSDTYILGTAMRRVLEQALEAPVDLYRELVIEPLLEPLAASAIARTTRTSYDEVAQPLVGWGLSLLPDDVARLGAWLNSDAPRAGGDVILDRAMFDAAMQRDASDRGLPAGGDAFRYNNGFWGHDVAPYLGCRLPLWVPFMSGYGGISVVLFPNGIVYYYFSDGYTQRWREAAVEAQRMERMCE